MTKSKSAAPANAPPTEIAPASPVAFPPCPPPPDPSTALHPLESWYLQCHGIMSAHLERAPSVLELATYCGRSATATHRALVRLETRGVLVRDHRRRFVLPTPTPAPVKKGSKR